MNCEFAKSCPDIEALQKEIKELEERYDELETVAFEYGQKLDDANKILAEYLWLQNYSDPQTISEALKEDGRIEELEKQLIALFGLIVQNPQKENKGEYVGSGDIEDIPKAK